MGLKSSCVCLYAQNHTVLATQVRVPRGSVSLVSEEGEGCKTDFHQRQRQSTFTFPWPACMPCHCPPGSDQFPCCKEQFRLPTLSIMLVFPQVIGFEQYVSNFHFHTKLRPFQNGSLEKLTIFSWESPQPFTPQILSCAHQLRSLYESSYKKVKISCPVMHCRQE